MKKSSRLTSSLALVALVVLVLGFGTLHSSFSEVASLEPQSQTAAAVSGSTQVIFLTSGTSWTVPSDWNSTNNTIEAIGGGGAGQAGAGAGNPPPGAGGGGGGYAKATNVSLTPGMTVSISVGTAGTGGAGGTGSAAAGISGGASYLCNSTLNCTGMSGSAVVVGANGGTGGSGGTGGAGGSVSGEIGSVKYAGGSGSGGNYWAYAGGGGGGAAGPHGAGGNGGSTGGAYVFGGNGGGGNGGGGIGASGVGYNGGSGGVSQNGTAGGVAGSASSPSGGSGSQGSGGGAASDYGSGGGNPGGAGGNGIEWDSAHGSGGGGGGAVIVYSGGTGGVGGNGGSYGAGGGGGAVNNTGGAGGSGAGGIIVITYVSTGAGTGSGSGSTGGGSVLTTYTLSVTNSNTAGGTVTSNPTGISCGSTCSVSSITSGTSYTLTAVPNTNYTASWSGCSSTNGNSCSVTLNSNASVTVSFTSSGSGSTGGGITSSGPHTYYIDYTSGSGSDSNNGTSKSTPWQHAPGMKGFTGTYTHSAGDQFIFKGGVTWAYTNFPMTISNGGSAAASDYYGVDKTWYTGSSWSRPIFDGGGSAEHEIDNFVTIAWEGPNYITFDNLEMTDFYWASNSLGISYILLGTADHITIENSYFHNWSHAPCSSHDSAGNCAAGDGPSDDFSVILGNPNSDGVGDLVYNCIFDGSPNGTDSGDAVYDYPSVIRYSTATNMANGFIVGNYGELDHNNIGPINFSFSGNHENAIEQEGLGPISVFDNVIHDTVNEVIFVGNDSPSLTGTFTSYIYNNIIYNATHEPIFLMQQYTPYDSYVYNNIVESSYGFTCINNYGSVSGSTLNSGNNLCIADAGLGTTDPTSITMTHAQAQTAGYISGWTYQPAGQCYGEANTCYEVTPVNNFVPAAGSATIKAGTNLTSTAATLGMSALTSDLLGVSRPSTGPWDIGAYQYTGSGGGTSGTGSTVTTGSNFYIAQTSLGTGDGSSCANALPVSWFNVSSNWGTGPSQIGPGDTVHLCGTLTGAAGTTLLTAQGSGTAGKPITILFEPGANLTSPVWYGTNGGSGGAIVISGRSYITIDGGVNGIIQNTANGTGLAYQTYSKAINAGGCPNCEVKNLTIANLYVHTSTSDTAVDATEVNGIVISGSNSSVDNNTIHDVGWAIEAGYADGDTNVSVYNNNIYNIDHGVIVAGEGVGHTIKIYNNHIHDFANWDTTSDAYHHDGIHAFGHPVSSPDYGKDEDLWIYNNIFDGNIGGNATAEIFLEGDGGGTPWTDSTGTAHIFNNIVVYNAYTSNGVFALNEGSNFQILNNTIIGSGSNGATSYGGNVCLGAGNTTNPTILNNIFSNCNVLSGESTLNNPTLQLNNNLYADCIGSYNCWWGSPIGTNVDTNSYSTWLSGCGGCDTNSINDINASPGLDSSNHPISGSPAIGAGANLSSFCASLPGLCSDQAGISRPSTGPWDIGAYQYTGSGSGSTGGGTGSGSGTVPPPTISSVSSSNITSSGVTITWNTSTAASSDVTYGPTTVYGSDSGTNSTLSTTHSISLAGLASNTTYDYEAVSTDGSGNTVASSNGTFTTLAIPDTTPPTVSITAPTLNSSVSGSSVSLAATASDPGTNATGIATVQFMLDGAVLGSPLTAAPYTGTWNTTGVSNGTHTLTALATDGAGNTTTSSGVTVTVGNAVPPPVFSQTPSQSIPENALLSFTVSATDSSLYTLTYAASNLPAGATFNTTTHSFSWTPSYAQSGSYTPSFTVSDGHGGTATENVSVTVTNVNRAPTSNAGNNQTITLPANTAALSGSGSSDPDGDTLTYHWIEVSGPSASLSSASIVSPTASLTTAGTYVFSLTVTDPGGLQSTSQVTVTLLAATVVDSDGDGVPDTSDVCPNTPTSLKNTVNAVGCPLPLDSSFSNVTDLSHVNLNSVASFNVGNSSGSISFASANGPYDLLGTGGTQLDLNSNISITPGSVTLNSTALPQLDTPATITFTNILIATPEILRNDSLCSGCAIVSYTNNTLVFTVPGFSTYTIIQAPTPPPATTTLPVSGGGTTPVTPPPVVSSGGGGGSPAPVISSGGGGGGGSSSSGGGGIVGIFTPTVPQKPPTTCSIPSSALSFVLGARSSAITNLQTFLILQGYLPKQDATGYYGTITQGALSVYTKVHPACTKTTTTTISTNTAPTLPAATFSRNLSLGSSGPDVLALQKFLNSHGYLIAASGAGSPGHETTTFGPATKAALIRFQAAHGISPTGLFGPVTMGVVGKLI